MKLLVLCTLFISSSAAQALTCRGIFEPASHSAANPSTPGPAEASRSKANSSRTNTEQPVVLEDYQAITKKKALSGQAGKKPKFVDPKEEIAASKTWTGEISPRLFQDLLVENDRAIDHSLHDSSMEGVVKSAAGGSFVSVRSNVQFHGELVGTNAGVHAGALVSNASRANKSYVREEAKAVIVFLHGGGTKGTGHHVAISMQNYLSGFGIDVVSIDLPWHAEGPRTTKETSFEDPQYILEYVRAFIEQKIGPSGKPVIIAGHSWGGYLSDLYMQLYPKSKDKLVAGLIPLSGVPDLVPGGTRQQKFEAERLKALNNLTNPNIDSSDRSLSDGLLRQGKISPVAGAHLAAAMGKTNWIFPDHRGDDYLPTLEIMGKQDELYVGAETVWHDYREKLSNVQWEMVDAGHMIFDVTKNGAPQVYTLMKDFVSRVIGQPLEKPAKGTLNYSDDPLLTRLVIEWFNRPVFREFAKRATLKRKLVKPAFHDLDRQLKALRSYTAQADAIKQDKKQTEDQKIAALAALPPFKDPLTQEELKVEEALALRDHLHLIQKGRFVPEGPDAARIEASLNEQTELGQKVSELNRQRDAIRKMIIGYQDKKTREQVQGLNNTFKSKVDVFKELARKAHSPTLDQLRAQGEQMFERAHQAELDAQVLVQEHLEHLEATGNLKGDWMAKLPPSILEAFHKLEGPQAEYQKMVKKIEMEERREALSGQLGAELQLQAQEIFGPEGLEARLRQATLEQSTLEREMHRLSERAQELRLSYTEEVLGAYFRVESTPAINLFDVPAQQWSQNKGLVETVVAMWDQIWRERPPENAVSLY